MCKIQQCSVKVNLLLHLLTMPGSRIISILLLTLGFSTLSAHHGFPVPREGILDLREVEWNDQTLLDLKGEWLFYWEEFLDPNMHGRHTGNGIAVRVPSYWSS